MAGIHTSSKSTATEKSANTRAYMREDANSKLMRREDGGATRARGELDRKTYPGRLTATRAQSILAHRGFCPTKPSGLA